MPALEMCLGWVVQVNTVELAAHFETYVDLLSTLNAFRLCHRFGKDTPLSRLPNELAVHIEAYVIAAQRHIRVEELSASARCQARECAPSDHYTADQLKVAREEILSKRCRGRGKSVWQADKKATTTDARVSDEVLDDYLDDRDDVSSGLMCSDRAEVYLGVLGDQRDPAAGIFHANSDVLRQHFGLQVWLNRIPTGAAQLKGTHSTEAYLMLPASFNASERWTDDEDYNCNGFAFPFSAPQQQTQRSLKRFRRAQEILGLTAMFSDRHAATGESREVAAKGASPELKLMVTTCSESSDD